MRVLPVVPTVIDPEVKVTVPTLSVASLSCSVPPLIVIAAVLAGSNIALTKSGAGTVSLSCANTYTGVTTISGGTLSVSTLDNGGSNSNIGKSTNVAGNLVFDGGTLAYTGAAVSTDRLFTITNNGGTIDSSGSGALNFTNTGSIAYTGTNARSFTLTGSNTGDNTLRPILANNTGLTSLTKTGAGSWVLSGTNTYSGNTNISNGILKITGKIYCDASCGTVPFQSAVITVGSGATLDINNWAWNGSLGELTYDIGNIVINGGVLRYSGSTNTLDRDNAGRGFTVGSNGATFETVTSGVTWNLFRSSAAGDQPTFAGPVTLTGAGNGVMQHFIGGGSNLLKTGAGTWTLTGTNTYSGKTTISAGILSINSDASLGSAPGALTADSITLSGGA